MALTAKRNALVRPFSTSRAILKLAMFKSACLAFIFLCLRDSILQRIAWGHLLLLSLFVLVFVAGCRAPATLRPATTSATNRASHTETQAKNEAAPDVDRPPTLADYWAGRADFRMETPTTGLPMGESDTLPAPDRSTSHPSRAPQVTDSPTIKPQTTDPSTIMWSYVHASYPSHGVIDQCGNPVEFPGCIVLFESHDAGRSFMPRHPETLASAAHPPKESAGVETASETSAGTSTETVICQIPCRTCPCTSARDHIDQQQYPRVQRYINPHTQAETWLMVYEYRANVFLRRATDGHTWSPAEEVPLTGIWQDWLMPCPAPAAIGAHPFSPPTYGCLVGSPPGLYIDADEPTDDPAANPEVYIFVGLGQNPGAMGCYRGPLHAPAALYRQCDHNPLFTGRSEYGPLDDIGPATNRYFDFRTISSADVIRVENEYYMLYEGVRGPHEGAAGDTQFTLALARTTTGQIDGPWETYPHNPILLDMPGNVGVGHADLLILDSVTYLYTTLDGEIRSRLRLEWKHE